MTSLYRRLLRILAVLVAMVVLTPCAVGGILAAYVSLTPDQTVFLGTGTFQVSAVKHADEADWDMVARQNPPIYLGAKPAGCGFGSKSDIVFALTGIWLAFWYCTN